MEKAKEKLEGTFRMPIKRAPKSVKQRENENQLMDSHRSFIAGPTLNKHRILHVLAIDFNYIVNGMMHRTSKYDDMRKKQNLVIRRGMDFHMDINFNRQINLNNDSISFIFTLKDAVNPSDTDGTMVVVPVTTEIVDSGKWSAKILGDISTIHNVHILVSTDVKCNIGEWIMEIDTKISEGDCITYKSLKSIFMLFNPFKFGDVVYLEDIDEQDRFVLADFGMILTGTELSPNERPWRYGQYENYMLHAILGALKSIAMVESDLWSNPIALVRAITSTVNRKDNNGVLISKFNCQDSRGLTPVSWTGSTDILLTYFRTNAPVRYGNSWVTAGVVTTMCRALGIPCKPVTGYNFYPSVRGKRVPELFLDRELNEKGPDSLWNCHVWNEVFMTRPDIGQEHDGWQLIDGTPEDMFFKSPFCGPASRHSVRTGQILTAYDTVYFFPSTNAEIRYWKCDSAFEAKKFISSDKDKVCKSILCDDSHHYECYRTLRQDYKYKPIEGSDNTMLEMLARWNHEIARYTVNPDFTYIDFEIELIDQIMIGSTFAPKVKFKNLTENKHFTLDIIIKVNSLRQNGKIHAMLKSVKRMFRLSPKITHEIEISVDFYDYYLYLVDEGTIRVSCLAHVYGHDYEHYFDKLIRIQVPKIDIIAVRSTENINQIRLEYSFGNPLPIPLKNGVFSIEGLSPVLFLKIPVIRMIKPGEVIKENIVLVPERDGKHTVIIKFESMELNDVTGYTKFTYAKSIIC